MGGEDSNQTTSRDAEFDGVEVTFVGSADPFLTACPACGHMFFIKEELKLTVTSWGEAGPPPSADAESERLIASVVQDPDRWLEIPDGNRSRTAQTAYACPRCRINAEHYLPIKAYRRVRNLRKVLTALTPEERAVAAEALGRVQAGEASTEEITEELTASGSTTLQQLAELFAGRQIVHLAWLIMFVIAILTYLEQREAGAQDPAPPIVIVQDHGTGDLQSIIDEAIADALAAYPPPAPPSDNEPSTSTTMAPKVPRNAPCPCGSGAKFKKCHGA